MKAKEIIPASKPRNFVAKNQQTAGAGAHRDKKKEQKQGYEKHKGKGVAEDEYQNMLTKQIHAMTGTRETYPKGVVINSKGKKIGTWDRGLHLDPELEKRWNDENGWEWTQELLRSAPEKIKQGIWTIQNQGVAEGISVVKSDYDLDQMVITLDIEGQRKQFTYWDYDEDFGNAERRDVFDQLQRESWYKGLDHPTKMEILDAAYRAIRGLEPAEYRPTVDDEPLDMEGTEMERVRDPEDWDEGNTEPPNNFAIYINGKKWKVFAGRGYYADDERERKQYYDLRAWAQRKSDATGKKWTVSITGEPPTA